MSHQQPPNWQPQPNWQQPQYGPPQGYPQPVQPNVKQSRDKAQYVRQQTGHSLVKHIFLGWMLFYVPTLYYAVSPNHYFHA